MRKNKLRSHEVMDFKRCPKKWYWKWRMGLVPKAHRFSALEFGTWVHESFQAWFAQGRKRNGKLADHFFEISADHIGTSTDAPPSLIEKAEELQILGVHMMTAYEKHWERDKALDIVAVEQPLEIDVTVEGEYVTTYMLKPDALFRYEPGRYRLLENKTARSIRTGHLPIDGQARPYGVLAERAFKSAGILGKNDRIDGILYNYLRKALPDERERNAEGLYLNKNGSVSKNQPSPTFHREFIAITTPAKVITLRRIQTDSAIITGIADSIREGRIEPSMIPKTPHHSCEKFCDFFAMCVAEENGSPIDSMRRDMFIRQDPYDYGESTDEPPSFEMG